MINKSHLLTPGHHSVADWDWSAGLYHALDEAIYYEEPSSIKVWLPGWLASIWLCRKENTQLVTEGQLETAWRTVSFGSAQVMITFHNQAPLGTATHTDCYRIARLATRIYLYRYVAGARTSHGYWEHSASTYTWYRERWSWWIITGQLQVRMEYWNGDSWITVTPDLLDTSPPWLDSAINRLGLAFDGYINKEAWFDETYLRGRAP